MKKLVFMFAAIVAVSFAGNKAQTAEVDTDSVEVVDSADTTAAVADTVAADSVK